MTSHHQRTRITGLLLAAVAATVTIAPRSQAQTTQAADQSSRWQAWFGCWRASDIPADAENGPFVCVKPTAQASAVEVAMIDSGRVTTRDTLDASGADRPVDKQGCTGTERGDWSADTHRVFLHANLKCEGDLTRTSNTIVGITPTGEWLNVQSVTAFGNTVVRAMHYVDANGAKGLPAEFTAPAAERAAAVSTARIAASGALTVPSVHEAVVRTDTAAVQTWIVQRGVRFSLDAQKLGMLADAGVPSSVIDVMIGVSYPERFALNSAKIGAPAGGAGSDMGMVGLYGARSRADCLSRISALYSPLMYDPCLDPYAFGYGRSAYDYPYGYGFGYGYGYSPLFGYGYGYNPYLGGYYGGGYYGGGYYGAPPVVIVRGSENEHGRVVNGRGYTRGSTSAASSSGESRRSTGGSASASSGYGRSASSGSSGSTSSSSGSTSSGSSSGSSAGSSSSGSSGGGRTAHTRPPR